MNRPWIRNRPLLMELLCAHCDRWTKIQRPGKTRYGYTAFSDRIKNANPVQWTCAHCGHQITKPMIEEQIDLTIRSRMKAK